MKMIFFRYAFLLMLIITAGCEGTDKKEMTSDEFMQVEIFPLQEEHSHGSTIVELPNTNPYDDQIRYIRFDEDWIKQGDQ